LKAPDESVKDNEEDEDDDVESEKNEVSVVGQGIAGS